MIGHAGKARRFSVRDLAPGPEISERSVLFLNPSGRSERLSAYPNSKSRVSRFSVFFGSSGIVEFTLAFDSFFFSLFLFFVWVYPNRRGGQR